MTIVKLHNPDNLPLVIAATKQYMARMMKEHAIRPVIDHITACEVFEGDNKKPDLFALYLWRCEGNQGRQLAYFTVPPYHTLNKHQFAEYMHAFRNLPTPGKDGEYELADHDDFFDRTDD
jgi:hypothetical protein